MAERDFQEQVMRAKMKQEKECMYDNELIDNCFFSSRAKAENMAQTIQEMRDRSVSVQSIEKSVREAIRDRMTSAGPGGRRERGEDMAKTTLD